jgi:hypothetical protein
MKKILFLSILMIVVSAAPCLAADPVGWVSAGKIEVSSMAGIESINVGGGLSFQTAENSSYAGCRDTLFSKDGVIDRSVFTYAGSYGGTFGMSLGNGNNIGRQLGSAYAGFQSMRYGW